ncbi:MAG: hypothetical protein E6Q61_10115 [Nitrosomonas sp.]|nr:MAG: hypothetical protein E6Q61_10115 [Nitrosomonas sp.]
MKTPKFVSDESLARRYRMKLGDVLDLCVQGRFIGASYSFSKRRWFIPVPVRMSRAMIKRCYKRKPFKPIDYERFKETRLLSRSLSRR